MSERSSCLSCTERELVLTKCISNGVREPPHSFSAVACKHRPINSLRLRCEKRVGRNLAAMFNDGPSRFQPFQEFLHCGHNAHCRPEDKEAPSSGGWLQRIPP